MWVAVVPCCNSTLLIMFFFGSSACEWLWCLAEILACWSCLSLALQEVSGRGSLLQFKPADHTCPWLSRMWVAVVLYCNFSWSSVFLTLQDVSSCGALLHFYPANDACPWFSRKWVAMAPCYNISLLIMSVLDASEGEWLWCLAAILACWSCLFLALQLVSGHSVLLQF